MPTQEIKPIAYAQ